MPKYEITWNIGFGEMQDEIEADSYDDAIDVAYENALEDFGSVVETSAKIITDEEET